MKETQQFLEGLDKLTFVKAKNKTLYTKEGYEISYELELMGGTMLSMPIQFQFRVWKDKEHVMTWGCSSNEDVLLSVRWWQRKEWDMYTSQSDAKDNKRKELKNQFNQLIS